MSLDDRLRSAYRRNLEDVRDRVESTVLDGPTPNRWEPSHREPVSPTDTGAPGGRATTGPWPRPAGSLPIRVAGWAAAAAVVAVAGFGLYRLVSEPGVELVGADAAEDGGPAPTADDGRPLVVQEPPADDVEATPGTIPDRDSNSVSNGDSNSDSNGDSDADNGTPATSVAPGVGEESDDEAVTETAAELDVGVPTTVCPSGLRARLEASDLTYVGSNQGWGRKDDLVDEQDGPFYFEAWEPNHELPVTVDVVLDQPALAADIRVHQDPFTPVSGTITILVTDDGEPLEIGIGLSGTDGWRVHDFDQPVVIERFTIGRDIAEANIMEVMVCLASDTDS